MLSLAQGKSYTHYKLSPFIIITKDSVKQLPAFTDEEFYNTSSAALFKVNRTEIPDDDSFMKLYRDSVLPMLNRNGYRLRKVFIRGAASPEGPYSNNQRLGEERSKALLNELRRDLILQPETENNADISCITEDYAYLCLLMKRANDADYDIVKRIYDECEGDELCCKRKLMAMPELWNRLLREYFPELRAARLILWFSDPHAALATIGDIQRIVKDDGMIAMPAISPLPGIDNLRWKRRHLIAIRTNLLHDFFYMPKVGWSSSPNIQLEYYPLGGHLTYNIGMTWGTNRQWGKHKFFQIRDFQAEVRRYFRGGGEFMGTYLGAFLEGNAYGIGYNKEEGWEGEGGGAGISFGYVMPLNRKKSLRLELMVAAGIYKTYYDPYVYGNPITGTEDGKYYYDYLGTASKFKKRNHTTTWFGPLNVGIQLTYDIIYRKKTLMLQEGGKR